MKINDLINKLQPIYKKKLKVINELTEKLVCELNECDHMPVSNESIARSLNAIYKSSNVVGRINNFQTVMWNNNIGLNQQEKYLLNNILNQYKTVFYSYLEEY